MPIRKRVSERKPTLQEIADMPYTVGVNAKWKHYGIGKSVAEEYRDKVDKMLQKHDTMFKSEIAQKRVNVLIQEADTMFDEIIKHSEWQEDTIEDLYENIDKLVYGR